MKPHAKRKREGEQEKGLRTGRPIAKEEMLTYILGNLGMPH